MVSTPSLDTNDVVVVTNMMATYSELKALKQKVFMFAVVTSAYTDVHMSFRELTTLIRTGDGFTCDCCTQAKHARFSQLSGQYQVYVVDGSMRSARQIQLRYKCKPEECVVHCTSEQQ